MAFPTWNRKIHKTGRDEREMGSRKRTYRSSWLSEVKRSMIDGPQNDPQLTAHIQESECITLLREWGALLQFFNLINKII